MIITSGIFSTLSSQKKERGKESLGSEVEKERREKGRGREKGKERMMV